MANRTQTYLTSDWNIWTYVPEPGSFILDFSQLNGTDVLGTTGGSVEILNGKISNISLVEGGAMSQGIFADISPAGLQVSMLVENFLVTDSKKFLAGSEIWLTYKNAETLPDAIYGLNTPIFIGRIRSFDVDVTPGTNLSTISISATSFTEDDLNVLVSVSKNTVEPKFYYIAEGLFNAGITNYQKVSGDTYNFANTVTEVKTYGDWMEDISSCQWGIWGDDVQWLQLFSEIDGVRTNVYYPGVVQYGWSGSLPTITFNDESITGVQFGWGNSGAPTGVNLTNYADSELVYQYGFESNSNGTGGFNYSATVDVQNLTQMADLASNLLMFNSKFVPIEVTTLVANNYQDITFREINAVSGFVSYVEPVNLARLTQKIKVNLPDYGVVNEELYVSGRTIEITPDNWTTTYQLWKGFTN